MTNSTGTSPLDLEDAHASKNPEPRKLVRPRLSDQSIRNRQPPRRLTTPLLAHQDLHAAGSGQPDSQAELFYFQKQIQGQIPMVFVLDDGERIEGTIEWCDLNVIKVRHATRTMIYKSSIKYIYKAAEVRALGVMTAAGT